MAVGITQQYRDKRVCLPWILQCAVPEAESEDAGKGPEGLEHGDVGAGVETFGKLGYKEECEDVGCGVRDGEEVGVVGAEAEVSEGEG